MDRSKQNVGMRNNVYKPTKYYTFINNHKDKIKCMLNIYESNYVYINGVRLSNT